MLKSVQFGLIGWSNDNLEVPVHHRAEGVGALGIFVESIEGIDRTPTTQRRKVKVVLGLHDYGDGYAVEAARTQISKIESIKAINAWRTLWHTDVTGQTDPEPENDVDIGYWWRNQLVDFRTTRFSADPKFELEFETVGDSFKDDYFQATSHIWHTTIQRTINGYTTLKGFNNGHLLMDYRIQVNNGKTVASHRSYQLPAWDSSLYFKTPTWANGCFNFEFEGDKRFTSWVGRKNGSAEKSLAPGIEQFPSCNFGPFSMSISPDASPSSGNLVKPGTWLSYNITPTFLSIDE